MRISDWSSDVCSSDLWDRQQAESSRTSGQDSDCYRFGRCATSPPPFAGAEGPETFDRKALRPAGGKIVPEPDQAALAADGELLSRIRMRRPAIEHRSLEFRNRGDGDRSRHRDIADRKSTRLNSSH